MSAQKGSELLLKIGNDSSPQTFTTVAGLRTKSLKFNSEMVDTTNADSVGKWRELLEGAGINSCSASGSGVFLDSVSEEAVRAAYFAGSIRDWQIVVPGLGTFEGRFQITELQYAGDHKGETTYDISLESAGPISFA